MTTSVLGQRPASPAGDVSLSAPPSKKARTQGLSQSIQGIAQIIQAPFQKLPPSIQSKIFELVGTPLTSLVSKAFKGSNERALENSWTDFESRIILNVDYDPGVYALVEWLNQIYIKNPGIQPIERAKKLFCQITEELQILDPSTFQELNPKERIFDPQFYVEAASAIKNMRDRALEIMWDGLFLQSDKEMTADEIRKWLKDPANQDDILSVEELPLSDLGLPIIPQEISCFTNVTKIDLADNDLKGILPGTLDRLVHLKELDLSENSISALPPRLFYNCPELELFAIVDNNLTAIPELLFSHSPMIQKVNFTQNFITVLPANLFIQCLHLRRIELNCNSITELPSQLLIDCFDLEVFSISYNKINAVPENFFIYNNELNTVDLSGNPLATIHKNLFLYCVNLVSALLNETNFCVVTDDWFENCRKLSRLELKYNQIVSLTPEFCKNCKELKVVKFDENPNAQFYVNFLLGKAKKLS